MHKAIKNPVTNTIEKVTVFVTRLSKDGLHLLLIRHPYAGIQIPAGTVEPSENPEEAARREVFEETGLAISSIPTYLGCQETQLPADEAIVLPPATVYARPDSTSFDWIKIRSGVQVKVLRQAFGFTQIMYIEQDQETNPSYVSMQIIGWAPDESLARICRRHFFHLSFEGDTEPQWTVNTDCHTFTLFWAPWKDLPAIIPPQDGWLAYLTKFFEEEKK